MMYTESTIFTKAVLFAISLPNGRMSHSVSPTVILAIHHRLHSWLCSCFSITLTQAVLNAAESQHRLR